jgi:hypothetical protein
MILYKGRLLADSLQEDILKNLYHDLTSTLQSQKINHTMVIDACDTLVTKIRNHEFDEVLIKLLKDNNTEYSEIEHILTSFERNNLLYRYQIELESLLESPASLKDGTKRELYPLGVLLHIAAGNVDGLPAFSVIEGLMVGNINILKLPAGDNGLSIFLLNELIKIDERLKEFIYVFDIRSTDLSSIKKLALLSDGVVIWGSDAAVESAQKLIDTKTKLIIWGHKLSFAYITKDHTKQQLIALAHNICKSNQLLCSSPQGIYFDTDDYEQLLDFSKIFLSILSEVSKNYPSTSLTIIGKNSINMYTQSLLHPEILCLKENNVSVIVKKDKELEPSNLFKNVWIKALTSKDIIPVLKKHKNHLQTVYLLAKDEERSKYSELLAIAGCISIIDILKEDTLQSGHAHDGSYSLRLYSRIVES